MTQHELSELLNIDYDNLAAFETGVERINAKLLFQIAKLLDVRPDYFFEVIRQKIGRRPKIQT